MDGGRLEVTVAVEQEEEAIPAEVTTAEELDARTVAGECVKGTFVDCFNVVICSNNKY